MVVPTTLTHHTLRTSTHPLHPRQSGPFPLLLAGLAISWVEDCGRRAVTVNEKSVSLVIFKEPVRVPKKKGGMWESGAGGGDKKTALLTAKVLDFF